MPDSARHRVAPSACHRILLADDHGLFLEGLQNLLCAGGYQVVGAAHDGMEALQLARSLRPDVILMDVRMPGCDGLAATRLIQAEMPECKIVMLTTSAEDADLFEAFKSGASGYLLKKSGAQPTVRLPEWAGPGRSAAVPRAFGALAARVRSPGGRPRRACVRWPGRRGSGPRSDPSPARSPRPRGRWPDLQGGRRGAHISENTSSTTWARSCAGST